MNKKKLLLFCILLSIILFFVGCSLGEKAKSSSAQISSQNQSIDETPTPKSTPTAEPNQDEPALKNPVSFKINHYALTPDALKYLGDSYSEYKSFVDSILEFKDSFKFSDKDAKESILGVIGQFPLSALCNSFDFDFKTLDTPITYKHNADEFKTKVSGFEAEIAKIISENIFDSYTEIERAVYLYQIVSSYTYNGSASSGSYGFFTEKNGSAFGFADAFQYLLNQVGIKAYLATGSTGSEEDHRWVIMNIGDNFYNMDPTFENGFSGGKALSFFAMSDDQRAKTECSVPYSMGENGYFQKSLSKCSDTQFDSVFANTTSWKLDSVEHILYLAYNGNTEFTTSIKTDDFQVIY